MSGIRYSDAEKAKILDFIRNYDEKNGRGGKLQAFNKFKVSPLTLRSWIAESERNKKFASKKAEKTIVSTKIAAPSKTTAQVATGAAVKEKIALHIENIEKYSSQIADLQAKIEREKAEVQKVLC